MYAHPHPNFGSICKVRTIYILISIDRLSDSDTDVREC
jgi:hypothetical protein